MKIEAGKFYKTRGGLKAVVYATNGAGSMCIHGSVNGTIMKWLDTGRYYSDTEDNYDLVEEWPEEETRTVWLNLYEGGITYIHRTRVSADMIVDNDARIACVPVTFTFKKGDGLG